jgi:hypothetical protein
MQLSKLFPIAVPLEIEMPTGEKTGIVFQIVGQDSKAFRTTAKRIAEANLKRQDAATVDEMYNQSIELVCSCVVGWSGLEQDGSDQPLEYSPEKALELLSNPELQFIREQVEAFITQRATFFQHTKK